MAKETKESRPKPDIRVCEIDTEGGVGKQIGPNFTSKKQAEKWITKNFEDAEGKALFVVKVVRRVKIAHQKQTVVNVALEDAPPV